MRTKEQFEPSPRPWRVVDPHYEDAGVEVFDAEGARVCEDLTEADAALIVAAVNERDLLRDIVRRIETEMERCHRRDGEISQELMTAVYEASAIIGEGAR